MICGLWERSGAGAPGLHGMLAALPGPESDRRAIWTGTSVALGWRGRTAPVRAQRRSPCAAAHGLAVTASARLDGREALCDAVGVPAQGRATIDDEALILDAYGRWGARCAERLIGDFAFALWDGKRQELFCARDHIGARPFYYALAGGRFVFASDIEAVLAAPGVSDDLDESAVATRLTYAARPVGGRTCYRNVRRLLPGHVLIATRRAVRVERWWRPEELPVRPAVSDGAVAEAALAACAEAVRDRLRCGRRTGAHLSGGLDSSGVAALAARELGRQGRRAPVAFAWHPPPGAGPLSAAEAAEYGPIESLRQSEGLELVHCSPEVRDVVAFLRGDGARGADEPSLIQEGAVQRAAAARGVEVLLSGWGGDEGISFNGRGYYPQLLRSGRLGRLWRNLREARGRPLAAFVTQAALPLAFPGAAQAWRRFRRGEPLLRKNVTFIDPDFAGRAPLLPAESPRPAWGRDLQLRLLRRGHLSRRMEGWFAAGARLGIEYRYPLLDRRVLELALELPPEQFRRGRWSRWLMRRAFSPVLPPEVAWNRQKHDPVRFEALRDAVAGALPAVRAMIEERATPPARSRYLDMPRLIEQMDPERWLAGKRPAPFLNALSFLDF